jgi:hypothetical protein
MYSLLFDSFGICTRDVASSVVLIAVLFGHEIVRGACCCYVLIVSNRMKLSSHTGTQQLTFTARNQSKAGRSKTIGNDSTTRPIATTVTASSPPTFDIFLPETSAATPLRSNRSMRQLSFRQTLAVHRAVKRETSFILRPAHTPSDTTATSTTLHHTREHKQQPLDHSDGTPTALSCSFSLPSGTWDTNKESSELCIQSSDYVVGTTTAASRSVDKIAQQVRRKVLKKGASSRSLESSWHGRQQYAERSGGPLIRNVARSVSHG